MLLQGVFNGDEVLERLGHLAARDGQVARVQEVPDPAVVLKVGLHTQGGRGGSRGQGHLRRPKGAQKGGTPVLGRAVAGSEDG